MQNLLWTIPFLPLAGFLILSIGSKWLSPKASSTIGVSTVAISTLVSILVAIEFISGIGTSHIFKQELGTWIDVPGFSSNFGFYLDSLSMVFVFIVSFVGFLIHLYSAFFMKDDEGIVRYFAWMNLFMASMLILVMADNLLMLYLGWEGVGLCSYLLIGYWYKDPKNGYAGRKAFIVTRIGDTAMAIGLFFLFRSFGTLNINEILHYVSLEWISGSPDAKIAALLLLGGAVGKSAQLPLQTWLPDAMAGPSPVSALIHAATMVTAGVYLIARTNLIFSMAPNVMLLAAAFGAIILVLAGFSALVQSDIKRVLAYSTISQIGYMFLALGVGAWSAGIFHFFVHAFFKALLFLAAGVVIIRLKEEHDMFKMGGLRKKMPLVFYTFIAGAASLSALPLVTAGFFSKDKILMDAFLSPDSGIVLWIAGLVGAGLTALYTTRMIILTFFGDMKIEPEKISSKALNIPLVILAVLSIVAGYIEMAPLHLFSKFMAFSLPELNQPEGAALGFILPVISGLVVFTGIFLAWYFYQKRPEVTYNIKKSAIGSFLYNLWFNGWAFDEFYDKVFVQPYIFLARINKNDFIDLFYTEISNLMIRLNDWALLTQTGRLRWYLALITVGVIFGITIIIFL
ncbi:MAG: NADH-quinone oxidoreductase subunit L [Dysgonamonadaceae bacterium]|nr:NADH-quinone oxidoreductase subunit L [Dysgonamonadaceae bacterium]MDD4245734.1 NADH-quinone oxidoreductase subunit L [Dysgonamonadaceae bacterium]MDD4605245.1 NADH-quinone oxidoreductase subunit L [Dysgonamonadaceae bacterium]